MEVLHEWHEFYLLVGTAAATVLALLFVAVSLGAGLAAGVLGAGAGGRLMMRLLAATSSPQLV